MKLAACLFIVTFANATWPEREICAAPAGLYGEATEATFRSAATFASIVLTCARTGVGDLARADRDDDLLAVA